MKNEFIAFAIISISILLLSMLSIRAFAQEDSQEACPTDGNYTNHGEYVSCVAKNTENPKKSENETSEDNESDDETKGEIVSEAARSDIGKPIQSLNNSGNKTNDDPNGNQTQENDSDDTGIGNYTNDDNNNTGNYTEGGNQTEGTIPTPGEDDDWFDDFEPYNSTETTNNETENQNETYEHLQDLFANITQYSTEEQPTEGTTEIDLWESLLNIFQQIFGSQFLVFYNF